MNKKRFLVLIGIGLLGVIILLLLQQERTITIQIEGQAMPVTTSARRVAEILDQAGFPLSPEDQVSPAPNTRIREGDTITLTQASHISILADGEVQTITSTERIPSLWLDQAEITLSPDDRIILNGQDTDPKSRVLFQPRISLEIRRAITISLESDGRTWSIRSSAPTLGQALWDASFQLTASDVLRPAPETPLTGDLSAILIPGQQIQVIADGQTVSATTSASTVGEALAQTGFALQGLDYSIPAEDAPLPDNGSIQIVRVVEQVVINQEAIPYQTVFQPLDDVEIDNYRVAKLGQVGIAAQRVRIKYEDGEEVSQSVEDQWTLREAVDRVEGYGTKIVVRTENTPDGPIEYWRKVNVWATSYSPCNSGVDQCLYSTSSGIPVTKGVVAVMIDWYRVMVSQNVYIPGYGSAVIADVGPGWVGRYWIDLGYEDDGYIPWAKWVDVYFTTPVPPADKILYVLPHK
jgi:uncharacterized protein YabE (DUF348 family)